MHHTSHHVAIADAVACEFDDIVARIEADLVPLLVRRSLIASLAVLPARTEAPPPRPAPVPRTPDRKAGGKAIRMGSGPSEHVILKALSAAPDHGLPGPALNALIMGAGMSLDAAEKSKTRMRHRGVLAHDLATGRWSLTAAFRESYPNLAERLPTDPPSNPRRRSDPRDDTAGRIMMDLLSRAPPSGLRRKDMQQAVVAAGHSLSLARHAVYALGTAGHIEKIGVAPNLRWRLAPSAR